MIRTRCDTAGRRDANNRCIARNRNPQHRRRRRVPLHGRQEGRRDTGPSHQREEQGGGELHKVNNPRLYTPEPLCGQLRCPKITKKMRAVNVYMDGIADARYRDFVKKAKGEKET